MLRARERMPKPEATQTPTEEKPQAAESLTAQRLSATPAMPSAPPDLSNRNAAQRTSLVQRHAQHFGNQSTLRLLRGNIVQADRLVAVPGVLDNGVMTNDYFVEVNGQRRSVPANTYVEIYERIEATQQFRVRAYSGFGGIEMRIPQSSFRHERQRMPPRRDTPVVQTGDTAETLPYARPGEPVLDNGYLRMSTDFAQPDVEMSVELLMHSDERGYESTGETMMVYGGTYVEVIERRPSDMLRVRLHSDHQGVMALVEARYFHHFPQIPDRERRDHRPDVGQVDQSISILGTISPLWDATTGPVISDVEQQQIGDCYLLAAAIAVLHTNPNRIRQIFGNPANLDEQSYTVHLYRRDLSTLHIEERTYTVDRSMLARDVRHSGPGSSISRPFSASDIGAWVPLLERAYAEHAQGYDNITLGGNGRFALIALTGQEADMTSTTPPSPGTVQATIPNVSMSDSDLIASIRSMLAARRPMTAGTPGNNDHDLASQSLRIFANHEYAILGLNSRNRIQLHNPHGYDQPVRAITAAELKRIFVSISTGSPLPGGSSVVPHPTTAVPAVPVTPATSPSAPIMSGGDAGVVCQ